MQGSFGNTEAIPCKSPRIPTVSHRECVITSMTQRRRSCSCCVVGQSETVGLIREGGGLGSDLE